MHGFATYGIQVVSGTEIRLGKAILRSTKDNPDLTKPTDSPGEAMGGSESIRSPACTKQIVFNKIFMSNVVCKALQSLVFTSSLGPKFYWGKRFVILRKTISI